MTKEQRKSYHRRWYAANKSRRYETNKAWKTKIVDWYTEYKSKLSCVLCGESFIRCLHFHHRDASLKVIEVSIAAHRGWSVERILEEIGKCDVLCANCHIKMHNGLVAQLGERLSCKQEAVRAELT